MQSSIIDRVEVHEFTFQAQNLGVAEKEKSAIYNLGYCLNSITNINKFVLRFFINAGCKAEHVTHWVSAQASPTVMGRNAKMREAD